MFVYIFYTANVSCFKCEALWSFLLESIVYSTPLVWELSWPQKHSKHVHSVGHVLKDLFKSFTLRVKRKCHAVLNLLRSKFVVFLSSFLENYYKETLVGQVSVLFFLIKVERKGLQATCVSSSSVLAEESMWSMWLANSHRWPPRVVLSRCECAKLSAFRLRLKQLVTLTFKVFLHCLCSCGTPETRQKIQWPLEI